MRYLDHVREGTPIADLASVTPGRSASDAAIAVLSDSGLSGWLLATDNPSLAASLVRRGAAPKRHALVMQCDLRQHPASGAATDPYTLSPLPTDPDPAGWTGILPSWRAAFPPDHPDHFAGDDKSAISFLSRLVDGSELGPLHRSTTVLVDGHGCAVAGIVVNIRPQDPPWGGAWIADIWRDPGLRGSGLGSILIDHAKTLLLEDGHARLSLAVTSGNDARRGYERAGFRLVTESQTVQLPVHSRQSR